MLSFLYCLKDLAELCFGRDPRAELGIPGGEDSRYPFFEHIGW
jgi:hypothetical protein